MPKEAKKLTKKRVEELSALAREDHIFSRYEADIAQPGLHVWARSGRAKYVFTYRPPGGGPRKRDPIDYVEAISLAAARSIAQDRRELVAAGRDPQEERRQKSLGALSLHEAARAYLEDLQERAIDPASRGSRSGYQSQKRLLEKHVLPALGTRSVRSITVDDVTRMHRSMRQTPGAANRTKTALSAVFSYANKRMGLEVANPCLPVDRFKEEGKRHPLDDAQLQALGAALRSGEETGTVASVAVLAIQLFALTGYRRAELLGHESKARRGPMEGLRWGDVDLNRGLVRIRDSKAGETQTRVVGQAVVDLLHTAKPPDATAEDCVVPSARRPGQPFTGIDKPRAWLYAAAGIEDRDLHSLRHSFISIGAHLRLGRYENQVGTLAGHGRTSGASSITRRYIHDDLERLRPAADAISAEIARLLGLARPGDVLAFPNARGLA
jgi:integrase